MRETSYGIRALAVILTPALIAVAIHLGALRAGFVYDDVPLVRDNPLVTGPLDAVRIFGSEYWAPEKKEGLYRPVTILSFAALGPRAFAHHAANLLLHGIATALVALLALRLSGSQPLALSAGLLFATHPVHVEAVAPVVGRSELLGACFALGAVLSALSERGAGHWISPILFLLAVLSKESSLLAAPLLILAAGALGRIRTLARPAILVGWPAACLLAILLKVRATGALGLISARISPLSNPIAHAAPLAGKLTALKVALLYAERLLFPLRLASDYSYDQISLASSPWQADVLLGGMWLCALAAGAWVLRRRSPVAAAGLAFLFVSLIAASNLLMPVGTIAGERLLYFPSVGFVLAISAAILAVALSLRARIAVTSALAMVLAARSVARVPVFQDARTLFEAQLREAPRSVMAHLNVAATAYTEGRFAEAERHYRQAAEIAPLAVGLNGLGASLMALGRAEEAAQWFERATRAAPEMAEAWNGLAAARSHLGDREGEAAALRRLLALEPGRAGAMLRLGILLADSPAPAEAIPLLQRYVSVGEPGFEAYYTLAIAHLRSGVDLKGGIEAARTAVALRPMGPRPHAVLAQLAEAAGDTEVSGAEARRAIDLAREDAVRAEIARSLASILGRAPTSHPVRPK